MIAPLLLLAYVTAVALLAPRLLVRMPMLWRAPRAGLALWQCAVVGVLSALVLLLVGALIPTTSISVDWGHLVHACHPSALVADTLTGLGGVRLLSSAVAGATLLRLLWAAVTRTRAMVRSRRRQRYLLDLLAPQQTPRPDQPGMHVLTSDVPAAYCVPGGQGRIVLTSGAVLLLTDPQRAAVVAHERAHLRGRHDLVLLGAGIAAAAFGPLSFFRTARTQLSWLLEMLADDAAARAPAAREPDVQRHGARCRCRSARHAVGVGLCAGARGARRQLSGVGHACGSRAPDLGQRPILVGRRRSGPV